MTESSPIHMTVRPESCFGAGVEVEVEVVDVEAARAGAGAGADAGAGVDEVDGVGAVAGGEGVAVRSMVLFCTPAVHGLAWGAGGGYVPGAYPG